MKFKFRGIARRNKVVFALFTLVVIGSGFLYLIDALHPNRTEAAWFNTNWQYRKAINITAHTSAESNVYLDLSSGNAIDTSDTSRFQGDCGDLRFTDQNGNALPYYIVSGCVSSSTVVHVFMKTFPAGAQTIYYYYGNPTSPNGFSASDFSTASSGVTIGTLGSEENGPAPTAYWKFDEGTGTTANDSSSNGNTGTLQSSPTWQTENQCITGKCLLFSGSNYVSVPNNPTMNPTTAYTIESWIKLTSIASSTNYNILAKQVWASKLGYRLFIAGFGCSNCIGVSAGDGINQTEATSTEQLTDLGAWHHVVGVFSSGTLYIYLDGKLIKTTATAVTTISNTSTAAAIGRHSGGGENFPGFIDDVKIYKYVRTASQIQTDYSSRGSVKGISAQIGGNNQLNSALSNGLVGYWKMDEATWSGTLAEVVDASGNGNHGQAQGATNGKAYPSTPSKFGSAGQFDGVDNRVSAGNAASLQTGAQRTAAVWVKFNSIPGSSYNSVFYALGGADGASGDNENLGLLNNKFNCDTYAGGNGINLSSTTVPTTGVWYHVACVYDATKTVRIYVNGILENTGTFTGDPTTSGTTLLIGEDAYASVGYPTRHLDGSLDELRLYNRALSGNEISQLYNFAPGPIYYTKLDEGSGTTTNDSSGNGYNGSTATVPPKWVSGKYGGALQFTQGSLQRSAATVSSGPLSILNDHSISMWVKFTDNADAAYRKVFSYSAGSDRNPGVWTCPTASNTLGLHWRVDPSNSGFNCLGPTGDNGSSFAKNTWYYITVTRSGASGIAYINGVKITTVAFTNPMTSGAGTLYLGSDSSYGAAGMVIDDFKIYNYPRTAKQIVSDMNANHPNVGSPIGSAVGHWKFDEGFGTTTGNSGNVGTAIAGTLTNMASPATGGSGWNQAGKFSKALAFDGTNDYVSIPDNSALSGTSAVSLSAWINPSAGFTSGYRQIINRASSGATASRQYLMDLTSGTGTVRLCVSSGSTEYCATSTTALTAGNWYHTTGVYDGSTLKMYINGKLETTSVAPASINSIATTDLIGTFGGGAGNYFLGLIDEVKVYNYPLTADEVKLDMNRGSSQVLGTLSDTSGLAGGSVASNSASAEYCIPGDTTSCAAPVARWDFEEGQGITANDATGNNNTGTWSGTAPYWGQGKIGKGGKFNGSNNYISLLSPIQLTGAFTYQTWFKRTTNGVFHSFTGYSADAGATASKILFHTDDGIFVRITDGGSSTDINVGYTASMNNTWNFLVVERDGSNVVKASLNGAPLISGATLTGTYSFDWMGNNFNSQFFNGSLDNTRIYNYARTAGQVGYDYNRGGPISYWKFDDCKGTTINDSSGNGNRGTYNIGASGSQTVTGTCTTPTDGTGAWYNGRSGKYNSAGSFDGTNDSMTATVNGQSASYVTVSLWAKINAHVNWNDLAEHNWVGNGWWLGSDAGGSAYFTIAQGGVQHSSGGLAISTGTWYHFVGVYDGTTVKLYVNGVLSKSSGFSNAVLDTTAASIQVGSNNTNAFVDDVRVYNYPLTASQIKLVYNQGAAVRFGPATGTP